jgi:hypothetical protein
MSLYNHSSVEGQHAIRPYYIPRVGWYQSVCETWPSHRSPKAQSLLLLHFVRWDATVFLKKPILIITSSQLTNCVLTVHRYLYKLFAEVTTETEEARPDWCTTKQCCSFLPIGCLKALCWSNYSNRNSSSSLVHYATMLFLLANWLSQGSLLG